MMTTITTIAMAIVVTIIVATIMLRFKSKDTSMITVVLGSACIGIVTAVFNNYLVPDFPNLSWLYLLMAIAFIGALVYQWDKQGSDLVEFLLFTALTLIVGGVAKAAAANYHSAFLSILVAWAIILPIGFYGFTAFKFHRKRNTLKDEDRERLLEQKNDAKVKEMDNNVTKFNHLMAMVAAITIITLAGVTGLILGMANNDMPKDEQTQTSVVVNAADTDQDLRFVQEWTENENNRLDSEFAAKLAKKAEADDGTITPEIVQEAVLENCGHDARMLAIWANAFGLRDNPNDYEDLLTEDKSYLSDTGISLYNKVEGYLAATTVTREEAPEDGYNSGYADGYVSADYAGISGDRSGTKFVSPDKNVETFWLMDRCSNLVYRKPNPNVPNGPTDEPTPTPPENNPKKDPAADPVNRGNAQKGGGQNKPNDGAGENQPKDPRTEHPTGSGNDNNHGYSDPKTVTPSNPAPSKPAVTDSKPMDYSPDPVTNRGPADSSKKPTSSEGDGEFTPSD